MTNKEFFQQCWKSELIATTRALKGITSTENINYKPAEKYRTAKQLVDHFVSHVEDLIEGVESGVINHRLTADYPSVENATEVFEKETDRLMALTQPSIYGPTAEMVEAMMAKTAASN